MTVPYEVTASDLSQLFIPEGECNGQGSRHVIDGALIRVMPCKCVTCESGKAERKQAYAEFENKLAAVRRTIDDNKKRNQPSVG